MCSITDEYEANETFKLKCFLLANPDPYMCPRKQMERICS